MWGEEASIYANEELPEAALVSIYSWRLLWDGVRVVNGCGSCIASRLCGGIVNRLYLHRMWIGLYIVVDRKI